MILLPKNRRSTSPGRMLKRFLHDYGLTQTKLAELTDMQLRRVNEVLRAKRAVTPDTALRLARFFGTTPDLWLNAQLAWDLWHAARESGAEIEQKVTPLAHAAKAQARGKSVVAGKRPLRRSGGGGAP